MARVFKSMNSKYKPEFVQKTIEYIIKCQDTYKEVPRQTKSIVKMSDKGNSDETHVINDSVLQAVIPTLEGLAEHLTQYTDTPDRKLHKDTIQERRNTHVEFTEITDYLLDVQKNKLISQGLSGVYNPHLVKFLLENNHNMTNKTEVTVSSGIEGIKDMTISELEELRKNKLGS